MPKSDEEPYRMEHVPAAPDAAAVTASLRERAGLWRALDRTADGSDDEPESDAFVLYGWDMAAAYLAQAERNSTLGDDLEMRRFRGVWRLAARAAARCIVFFARFLVRPQRMYNAAVLEGLRTYQTCVQKAIQAQAAGEQSLRRLVAAQDVRIRCLEREIAALKEAGGERREILSGRGQAAA